MEELVKEVETMTSLGRHDNVVELIGCACSTDGERELECHQPSIYRVRKTLTRITTKISDRLSLKYTDELEGSVVRSLQSDLNLDLHRLLQLLTFDH